MNHACAPYQTNDVPIDATLDLAKLARIDHGDRIEVERIANRTLELFARTIRLLDAENRDSVTPPLGSGAAPARFVPEHEDLRRRFLFAEVLGSYATLQDLLDAYSPGYKLSVNFASRVSERPLTETEVKALVDYDRQINSALAHANQFLLHNMADGYSYDEIHELNAVLVAARERAKAVTAILGEHLIHQVELAVQRLHEYHGKIHAVQKTIGGIFLIDTEVMFIPTTDLIACVNTIFDAVGNPYVAEHINGLLLLAARNMLIETVSFFSYYGKQQIYNVCRRKHAGISKGLLTHHIRDEIRTLFQACRAENRLVLTRIMKNTEREFDISVEAIRAEAEQYAVEAVTLLLPPEPAIAATIERPGLLQRLAAWMFR